LQRRKKANLSFFLGQTFFSRQINAYSHWFGARMQKILRPFFSKKFTGIDVVANFIGGIRVAQGGITARSNRNTEHFNVWIPEPGYLFKPTYLLEPDYREELQ
jgi:hypothetical protein